MPRVRLATLPTPLEEGPTFTNGPRLWVKRDDLTGLGMGGNKARKLEFLCGRALADGATCLVTVGAGQSNHCRMTAAAGAAGAGVAGAGVADAAGVAEVAGVAAAGLPSQRSPVRARAPQTASKRRSRPQDQR